MSTSVYPYLPIDELTKAEDQSAANELAWLLESLDETLVALKNGLEDCSALLAPTEPGSTLVLSSRRSESIKGHVTRVGSRIVKGTINLRLKTQPPLNLSLTPPPSDSPSNGFSLPPLSTLRDILSKCLSCLTNTRRASRNRSHEAAMFLSSQLRVLHALLQESLDVLQATSHEQTPPPAWFDDAAEPAYFTPELPCTLAINLRITDSSALLLTVRVLEPALQQPSLGSRFLTGIGVQRRLEHDEMNQVSMYHGEEVRVREKCMVESSADPCLLSCSAKLGALERTVFGARESLRIVMGAEQDA